MSEMRPQLVATAVALFAAGADWPALAEAGLPLLLVPEAAGGFGGDWGDAAAVLAEAGRAGLAQPLAEAMIAARLLARAGVAAPDGLVTLALLAMGAAGNGCFTGSAAAVPWGQGAWCLVAVDEALWLVPPGHVAAAGANPADEPRPSLAWTEAPAIAAGTGDLLPLLGWARAAQAAGALAAALALASEHTSSRVQFGKPLSKQQAVQQQLAVLAAETAAVTMAVAAAARALDQGDAGFECAAAKLRANLAIDRAVPIAHQVHGAIGFTADYPLHRLTRRLIAWRSEAGNDAFWAARLGTQALAWGGAGLWAALTDQSDR